MWHYVNSLITEIARVLILKGVIEVSADFNQSSRNLHSVQKVNTKRCYSMIFIEIFSISGDI